MGDGAGGEGGGGHGGGGDGGGGDGSGGEGGGGGWYTMIWDTMSPAFEFRYFGSPKYNGADGISHFGWQKYSFFLISKTSPMGEWLLKLEFALSSVFEFSSAKTKKLIMSRLSWITCTWRLKLSHYVGNS